MKRIKLVINRILKSIVFHILLWVLMLVLVQKNMDYMGFWGGEKWPGIHLRFEPMNAPKETAYVDVLIKMDDEDPNYVDFTMSPKRFKEEYIDGCGWHEEYVELPITSESEIAKWNEDGYVSLTLHHKDIREFKIKERYEKEDGSYVTIIEGLDVIGRDIYGKYHNVKAAYVDEEGNVLKVTEKSTRKYIGDDSYYLVVDGDSVVFKIGEPALWISLLFYLSVIMIPVYPIILIVWGLKKAK